MAQNFKVDSKELCEKIKEGKASKDEVQPALDKMDEDQFRACFLEFLRAAVQAEHPDMVALILRKMSGRSLNDDENRDFKMAKAVVRKMGHAVTTPDCDFVIFLFQDAIKCRNVEVVKFLLDELDAPLHHAIWNEFEWYDFLLLAFVIDKLIFMDTKTVL